MTQAWFKQEDQRRQPVFVLDVNVWRYLIDNRQLEQLHGLGRRHRFELAIAPSVLYEMLKNSDKATRSDQLHAVTDRRLRRLLPEAYWESMEVAFQILVRRRDWARDGDPGQAERTFLDWTRGARWNRARYQATSEIDSLDMQGQWRTYETAATFTKQIAKHYRERGFVLEKIDLHGTEQPVEVVGDGTYHLDVGQAEGMRAMFSFLETDRNAHNDWIGWVIDRRKLAKDAAAVAPFWSEAFRSPRLWVRGAFTAMQPTRRVNAGSPADNQLSCHLVDGDFLITADTGFAAVAGHVRKFSSWPLAEVVLVKPLTVVDGVLQAVESWYQGTDGIAPALPNLKTPWWQLLTPGFRHRL